LGKDNFFGPLGMPSTDEGTGIIGTQCPTVVHTELRSFSVLFAFFFGSFSFFSKEGARPKDDRRHSEPCPKVRHDEGVGRARRSNRRRGLIVQKYAIGELREGIVIPG